MTALEDRLAAALGAEHVEARAGGLVARPGSTREIVELIHLARTCRARLRVCDGDRRPARVDPESGKGNGDRRPARVERLSEAHAAVGSAAPGPLIGLSLERMAGVLHLDPTSLLVHVQAGMSLARLEGELARHRLVLPGSARSSLERTVGAVLAAPRPIEAGAAGPLLDACAAVDAVLADGVVIATRLAPRRASGPDLSHALLGARGATGILVAAWLRVERAPPASRVAGWAFPDGVRALDLVRELLAADLRPAALTLLDATRARRLGDLDPMAEPAALVLLRCAGVASLVDAEIDLAAAAAAERGGRAVAPAIVERGLEVAAIDDRGQRHVDAARLGEAWSARAPGSGLTAFHARGAALLSPARLASPGLDRRSAVAVALAHELDPEGLFAEEGAADA